MHKTLLFALCVMVFIIQTISARPAEFSAKAQEHADRGLQLAQEGDLKGAEAELRQAVELSPHESLYLASLGSILGMQQKLQESSAYFVKALNLNPNDFATRRNLASNQFQLGELLPAKENLERVLKVRPRDRPGVLLLGMVSEELKNYDRAARLLESVMGLVRQRSKSIAALARSYYYTNQKGKAQETLKSLQNHPEGPEAVFLGGQVAAEIGDLTTAEVLYKSIASTYPDSAKLAYNLALVQYRANRFRESQATLRELVGSGQASSDVYNLLAWCYHKQGKAKESVEAMDRAIQRDPAKESNYFDMGLILLSHNRLPAALEAAKKALEVAPTSFQAYKLKGLIETQMNHPIEAAQTYKRAVELNPAAPEAILGLALSQSAEGLTQEATATFEMGIKQFPQDARLHQEYARMLLRHLGDGDAAAESRAVSLLKTAIALDASLAGPYYQLGNHALNKGKTEDALQHLKTAARLDKKSSKIHFALSRAYRRLGQTEKAAKESQIYEQLKAEEEKSCPGQTIEGFQEY